MPAIKFTEGEARFLCDRLEQWDAIADCFANSEGMEHHSDDDVQVSALALLTAIKTDALDPETLDECERDVLRDAIEGSTYIAQTGGRDHPGAWAAAKRVARSAVAKLRAAGFECDDAPEN